MKILIVGAGATGGILGAHLAKAGRDVTFLVREKRAAQLARDGLHILSSNGNIELAPKTVTTDLVQGPFDIVLLAVKAYAIGSALEDMAAAVGPDTVILPLLNGMRHMDLIAERFGKQHLLGCVCKVATNLDEQGRIVQQGTFFDLSYGELDGSDSTRLGQVHEFFSDAQFNARTSPVIYRDMWEKWLLLASMGSINCLMRGSIGDVVAAKGGLDCANAIIDEVATIVTAVGIEPSEAFLVEARRLLTLEGSQQTSSMYRDLVAGRPIEAKQIVGDLLTRAGNEGVNAPLLRMAYTSLQIYQSTLA
ncbi:ketopantoate reductase family protein [Pseudomonas sp. NPDC087358]|uniref:ketopantoate reductase family protein n=1 Tax=Pseudomonas sp. NPDC087358 TaxID=3364439 RepID=UPI00384DE689